MEADRQESDLWTTNDNFLHAMINAGWTVHWYYQWFSNKFKIFTWILMKRSTKCPKSVGTYVVFFHGYKTLSCWVSSETNSIDRQKYWHPSSSIQEPDAAWCKSKQLGIFLSQIAQLPDKDEQASYVQSNWPTTTISCAPKYRQRMRWEPVAAPLHEGMKDLTARMCKVSKEYCWGLEVRRKIHVG